MFTSSLRRAVTAAQPTPFVSALANAAPRAVCTQVLATQLARRFSSSKPSSPADGTNGTIAVPIVKADGSKKKAKAQRKTKDTAAEDIQGLPSVPSTGHLQVKGKPTLHTPRNIKRRT